MQLRNGKHTYSDEEGEVVLVDVCTWGGVEYLIDADGILYDYTTNETLGEFSQYLNDRMLVEAMKRKLERERAHAK